MKHLTAPERALQGVALLAALVVYLGVICLCAGCYSTDCGSKTIVGNHYSLPSLSSDATDFDFEIYRSTEGAVVYTRKDSRVGITFHNAYTNHIFGVWDKVGLMTLSVEIEPLAVEADFKSQISDSGSQGLEGGEQLSEEGGGR